ncbi:hypothetical protein A3D77_03825 [Candidatus Gottesmanbacteria bacterium RIFCSPHIGHO2_02_FULL_39_11]|uniref:Uncharacterized protein n=1 Tax=Candidatus Gottesmanbacteria bacterium RIFCSPHIGHO2_02_FULL_39_11 TaxID=1798382 RepID=A0A1F5ZYA5_9BACT|nr:MAG: hypothetical protein A3D77_03825 [Candidatus Gottesmanbacteria bacterium RIFCSPHIGHO2_02_FULL_39_11]
MEFTRGAYAEHLLEEKRKFLKYERFIPMLDHYKIHHQIYEQSLFLSRIYTHKGKPSIPLGDLLIIARISLYPGSVLFATIDKNDFSTLLFDRVGIATFTRQVRDRVGLRDVIEVVQFLKFNKQKFQKYLNELPK